jgi:hypothetical protein
MQDQHALLPAACVPDCIVPSTSNPKLTSDKPPRQGKTTKKNIWGKKGTEVRYQGYLIQQNTPILPPNAGFSTLFFLCHAIITDPNIFGARCCNPSRRNKKPNTEHPPPARNTH